jgi:cell division protein FtsI (penicillin-binding protein 3)
MRVQGALEDELSRGMLETEAIGAAGVILDVDTGEVLALARCPRSTPNRPDQAGEPLVFNKVTNQVYELGSDLQAADRRGGDRRGVVTNFAALIGDPFQVQGFTIPRQPPARRLAQRPRIAHAFLNIVTAHIADELGASGSRKA